MLEEFYVEDHAHPGFSGSFTFKKGQTGGYDVYGIYSGPLFTQEIKIFIENAAVYQAQTVEPDQKIMLSRTMSLGIKSVVSQPNEQLEECLGKAINKDDPNEIRKLLKENPNLHLNWQQSKFVFTLAQAAIYHKNVEIIKEIFKTRCKNINLLLPNSDRTIFDFADGCCMGEVVNAAAEG
jgi:hypothetical protein